MTRLDKYIFRTQAAAFPLVHPTFHLCCFSVVTPWVLYAVQLGTWDGLWEGLGNKQKNTVSGQGDMIILLIILYMVFKCTFQFLRTCCMLTRLLLKLDLECSPLAHIVKVWYQVQSVMVILGLSVSGLGRRKWIEVSQRGWLKIQPPFLLSPSCH